MPITVLNETGERKQYDPVTGQMVTFKQSTKAIHDRVHFELRKWHKEHDAPPPGFGIDGYPLQEGKTRAHRA